MKTITVRNRFPTQPWKTSFSRRFSQLQDLVQAGFSINLMLYEQPDSSTFRYRVYNIAQTLELSQTWRAVYFFADELDRISDWALRCQLITVVRFRWTYGLERLLTRARLHRIPIAFDSDDLVFDSNHVPSLINIQNIDHRTDVEMNYWFSYAARINLTAHLADAWTTTNSYLGQAMIQTIDRPVHVVRNFLNKEQIDYSQQCLQHKRQTTDQQPTVIGYFSGSPSHYFDLHSIADELCDLLDEFPALEILVVGYMDFAPHLQAYRDLGRIKCHPFVDFLTLQRLIAQVDINIAPLYPNEFTESKSELKFFEAAIVQTLTCASPTFTFREAIRSGETGYLCQQGEWYDTLRSVILEPERHKPLLPRAHQSALDTYSGPANLEAIEKVCQAMVDMVK